MMKQDYHVFTGMERDTSISKHKAEFLWEAHNIRITPREDSVGFSITNERGTRELNAAKEDGENIVNVVINGWYVGHCIIDNYVVLFTTLGAEDYDYIYRLRYINSDTEYFLCKELTGGNLNLGFDIKHPIETLGSYETDDIIKVYWVDGKNSPRVINIMSDRVYNGNSFDFVQNLDLKEDVKVSRLDNVSGVFAPGVIQYAITYYNKYLQESNIAYTTPLFYITHSWRGASPEDNVSCCFKLEVSEVDKNFDYIRCYAIQRSAPMGAPQIRRLTDVKINKESTDPIIFIDNGTGGDNVDASFLLYVGGEDIVASTFAAKDGTLFLGDIKLNRKELDKGLVDTDPSISYTSRQVYPSLARKTSAYDVYPSALYKEKDAKGNKYLTNSSYFKVGESYRCGVQFQHVSGKWSLPICFDDAFSWNDANSQSRFQFIDVNGNYWLPTVTINFQAKIAKLIKDGFVKARPVVVLPQYSDREIIAQGILCPTLIHLKSEEIHAPDFMPSWFLRPFSYYTPDMEDTEFPFSKEYQDAESNLGVPESRDEHLLPYPRPGSSLLRNNSVEVFSDAKTGHRQKTENTDFKVNQSAYTFHSPDIEFDENFKNINLEDCHLSIVGQVSFNKNIGTLDISTSSPPISTPYTTNHGFHSIIAYSENSLAAFGLIAPTAYWDGVVRYDQEKDPYERYYADGEINTVFWPTPAWTKGGSINNDVKRNSDEGAQSAVLESKKICNIKVSSGMTSGRWNNRNLSTADIQFFDSSQMTMLRMIDVEGNKNLIYYGNIDKLLLTDDYAIPYYKDDNRDINQNPNPHFNIPNGENYPTYLKDSIRIKYKSTPHIVALGDGEDSGNLGFWCAQDYQNGMKEGDLPFLYLAELQRTVQNKYYGDSEEAKQQNIWIPAGESVDIKTILSNESSINEDAYYPISIIFKYGDTWFQRYDCLKTYAFSNNDPNSIVEIGSFMCETRINLDGRYDRNQGLADNLVISPTIFNLINTGYTNTDNFFSYKILDEDMQKRDLFPITVTWTTAHSAASSTDNWTRITMLSTLDLSGNRGRITALRTFKDKLLYFQENSLGVINFNSRVQIPTNDNSPIEISNNYKVDGYVELQSFGVTNKWSIVEGLDFLYYNASNNNQLYALQVGQGVQSSPISTSHGFTNVFKNLSSENPVVDEEYESGFKNFYDNNEYDLYTVDSSTALNYSEKLNNFISFFSYEDTPAMFNIKDSFISLKNTLGKDKSKQVSLWQMFMGDKYNNFYGVYKPFDFSFISNPDSTYDKIFSNIEMRADFYSSEYFFDNEDLIGKGSSKKFFDYIRVFNEYQDTGDQDIKYEKTKPSNTKKKFRIWRVQIPRDKDNMLDRIRNPWCKIKFGLKEKNEYSGKAVIHDLSVYYHI